MGGIPGGARIAKARVPVFVAITSASIPNGSAEAPGFPSGVPLADRPADGAVSRGIGGEAVDVVDSVERMPADASGPMGCVVGVASVESFVRRAGERTAPKARSP